MLSSRIAFSLSLGEGGEVLNYVHVSNFSLSLSQALFR